MYLVSKIDTSIDYGFIRVVCTMFQPSRTNEAQMLQVMEKTYAGQMLSTPILLSEAIQNAGLPMSSIYEINKPYGPHQTYVLDRKRSVEGHRVTVSVTIGGLRNNEKKKN